MVNNDINFAITIRRTKDPHLATESTYRDFVLKLINLGIVFESYRFEHKGGLHLHGVIQVPTDFNTIKLRTRGWKVHLDLIYNYTGWINYIEKEQLRNDLCIDYIKAFQSKRQLPTSS